MAWVLKLRIFLNFPEHYIIEILTRNLYFFLSPHSLSLSLFLSLSFFLDFFPSLFPKPADHPSASIVDGCFTSLKAFIPPTNPSSTNHLILQLKTHQIPLGQSWSNFKRAPLSILPSQTGLTILSPSPDDFQQLKKTSIPSIQAELLALFITLDIGSKIDCIHHMHGWFCLATTFHQRCLK